jgi:hypothetical protein
MICILYEGDASDPMAQTMRVVRARSTAAAWKKYPHAIAVQQYEAPRLQPAVDLRALKTPQPVWGY